MMYNRERHGAALLANGQVLVAGGNSFPVYPGSLTSEPCNPATGKWTVTGSLKVSHIDAEAALLQDGRVLMPGCLDPPTRQEVSTKEARVRTIRAKFQGRHVHAEVLKYCRVSACMIIISMLFSRPRRETERQHRDGPKRSPMM